MGKTKSNSHVDENEIDAEIAALVTQVRDANEHIAELEKQIEIAKHHLRELLDQRGSSWADEYGYARIVSEGMRVSYDTRALDELIIKEPLHYGWLKDYRKESPVQGTIQVK